MHQNKNKFIGARILLAVLVAVFVFAAQPQPAYAILGFGDITFNTTIGDIPARLADIFNRIRSVAGSRAFHQAVRSVTYKLAQDSAVWLASGDKGQKPLVFRQPLGDALTDIGDQVAGKFLVNVSQGFSIDLCSPASVQSRLKLTIGISKSIQDGDLFPDRPNRAVSGDVGKTGCSLSDISGNFQSAYKNQKQALNNLSKGFDIDNNELGAFLILRESVQKAKEKQIEQEKSERKGEGFKAVTDTITGWVKTPSVQITEAQKKSVEKSLEQDVQPTGDIFADAAAIFTNTFAQTYLRRLQQGLLRGGTAGRGPGGLGSTTAYTGKQGLINDFSEFSPKSLTITSGSLSLISDMSVCPTAEDRGVYLSPYNCLLTADMRQAVEQKLTVGQAVKQNLIPKDALFPQAYAANTQNFSVENLKRLRFLRVIPVGWELAASRLSSPGVPFKTLLDCFEEQDNPTTTLVDESADPTLPANCPKDVNNTDPSKQNNNTLYHLVDPAWVLGLPQFQCNALAYGALPEYVGSPNRQSVCVDLASCIKEENGQCTGGYGYCTRERVTWDLSGTSCEPQYATCQTFTSPKKLSVLTAYVDNTGCTSQTAGCKWYSTESTGTDTWDPSKKIYLNNKSQSCSVSAPETHEVIPLVAGVNYVKNSGFDEELFIERPSGVGTIGATSLPVASEGGWDFKGQAIDAVYIPAAEAITPSDTFQVILIKPFTYYTLSFFAFPNPTTSAVSGSVSIETGASTLANISFENGGYSTSLVENKLTLSISDVSQYATSRFAASFYNSASTATIIELHLAGGLMYDDIQLEEVGLQQGANAIAAVTITTTKDVTTINTVPASGSINVASPTTQYKAYGTSNRSVFTNAGLCANPDETSARKYTSAKGGSAVYARLSAGGLCTASCNGFDTLLSMPTDLEKLANANAKPSKVQFIPEFAQSCTQQQLGCEVFTNVATEGREYYNRIESCVLDENQNTATFFTWEAGQLKSWQLLKDKIGNGPCTTYEQGQVRDPENAQCDVDTSESCTSTDGSLCSTFLDENGVEYKRDANKIITASNSCTQFRRTTEVAGVQQSWYFVPSEANRCAAAAVGCREYKGKAANVVKSVFTEPFESSFAATYQTTGQWDIPGVALSESTVNNQGTSVQFGTRLQMSQAFVTATTGHNFTNNTYELRFVAKALGGGVSITGAHLTKSDNSGDQYFFRGLTSPNTAAGDPPDILVSSEWRNYTLGPVVWPLTDQPGYVRITISGGQMLLDDLELVQIPDVYYRLQDSVVSKAQGGKQPDECYVSDANPALDRTAPRFNSCQQYRDDKNNTYYVSRFDKLFPSSQSLTCTAVIDTQNYNYPYSQAFNMGTTAIPVWNPVGADAISYRYIDPKNKTAAAAAGCTALGQPPVGTSVTTATVTDWSTAYKRVDPDEFLGASGTLCGQESLWCEAFTASKGGTQYFRDPGDKLCNWDPTAGPNGVGGFVKADGSGPCNTAGGDVPQCPQEANACTAYLPSDPTLSEGSTTALFRLSSQVSTGDCNGIADVSLGCVNFTKDYYTTDLADPNPIPKSKFLSGTSTGVFSVTQNRQCAEWLAPTTTSQAKQPTTQLARAITYDLGRCQKLNESGDTCVSWVTPGSNTYPSAYTDGSTARLFDLAAYQNRYTMGGAQKTIYSGAWDYSGYSLPGQYPVELLREVPQAGKTVLAYNQGTTPAASALECRGYPEQDSPFSRGSTNERSSYADPITYPIGTDNLKGLNLCEEKGIGCECSYKKAEAVGQTVWLSRNSTRSLPEDTKQISSYDGWYGYCLEESPILDPNGNKACIAWWPVDVVQGKPNVFENHPEAGFAPDTPLYYCVAAKGNKIANTTLGIIPVEEKDNTYVVKLEGDGGDGNEKRFNAYEANFYECVIHNDFCKVKGDRGTVVPDNIKMPLTQGSPIRQQGQKSATGLLQFPVKPSSPLSKLYEYDIEAIKLVVKGREASDWPENNEEFIISREGSARSTIGAALETNDNQWTTLWCGGSQDANCDFGGEYSWNKFMPSIMYSENCGSEGDEAISSGNNTNIFALRARFAEPDGSVDGFNINGINVGADGPPSFAPGSFRGDGSVINPYQFLGLEGGFCDNTKNTGWVDFQIMFQLREWCTDVVRVTDVGGENKAWAGRIQGNGAGPFDAATKYFPDDGGVFRDLYTTDFAFKQNAKPFGAITPPPDTMYDPVDWDSKLDIIEDGFTGETRAGETGKQPLYVEPDNGQVRAGSPYSCGGGTARSNDGSEGECLVHPATGSPTITTDLIGGINTNAGSYRTAMTYLKQIFAKVYKSWVWSTGFAKYVVSLGFAVEIFPDSGGVSDSRAFVGDATTLDPTFGQCPVIQAVVRNEAGYAAVSGEQNTVASGDCGRISNFGRYSINGAFIKHTDSMPNTSIEVFVGQPVELAFYAYNYNGEQLPIKKITIDWVGDGLPEDTTEITGNFKNHRDDCGGSNYGQSARACENAPFVFTHVFKKPGPASPKVRVEDNWGRYSWSSYNPLTPVLNIKHLNLNVLSPENLSITTALPSNNTAQPVQGDALTFAWTAPATQAGITRYEVTAKKNFSDGTSIVNPSDAPQAGLTFSIAGSSNMKSVFFEVSTCTDEGCGAPASTLVTFKPADISATLSPVTPVIDVPTVISWTANTIADTYEIELSQKDGVADSSAVVMAPNLQWTYAYEPSTTHVRIRVRPCNGIVCGAYTDTGTLTYQEVVGIISGDESVSVYTGDELSHNIVLNKSSDYTFSFSPSLPGWLTATNSGNTITLAGTPTLANARTYSGTIAVHHTGAVISDTSGSVAVTITSTCGDGVIQVDAGEACDPNSIATPMPNTNAIANYTINGVVTGNSVTKRCVPQGDTIGGRTECNWWPDADGDGIDGQTDCQNNVSDSNMYIGSSNKNTTQQDYNCDGAIESSTQCAPGATESRFGVAPSVCPVPGNVGPANDASHQWCRDTYGSDWNSIWRCNNLREVGCERCNQSQTLYW